MRAVRYWMRLSRFLLMAANWSGVVHAAKAVFHVRPGALGAYRFRRHLYYATSAIVMSIPSSNSDGDRYPSAFCIRLGL